MQGSARIDELRQKFHENPRRYFAPLANEYRKAGDPEQAIAICRAHLAQQPAHMSGHVVYAQALYDAGRLDESRVVFEKALSLDPDNAIVLRQLGDISRHRGDTAEAKHWYSRALEADPNSREIAAYIAELTEPLTEPLTEAGEPLAPTEPVREAAAEPEHEERPAEASEPAAAKVEETASAEAEEATPVAEVEETAPVEAEEVTPAAEVEEPAAPAAEEATPDSGPIEAAASEGHELPADAGDFSLAIDEFAIEAQDVEVPLGEPSREPEVAAHEQAPAQAPTVADDFEFTVDDDLPAENEEEFTPLPISSGSPFVTRTMADLYARQGYHEQALEVYRQLADANPNDSEIAERIRELSPVEVPAEQPPAEVVAKITGNEFAEPHDLNGHIGFNAAEGISGELSASAEPSESVEPLESAQPSEPPVHFTEAELGAGDEWDTDSWAAGFSADEVVPFDFVASNAVEETTTFEAPAEPETVDASQLEAITPERVGEASTDSGAEASPPGHVEETAAPATLALEESAPEPVAEVAATPPTEPASLPERPDESLTAEIEHTGEFAAAPLPPGVLNETREEIQAVEVFAAHHPEEVAEKDEYEPEPEPETEHFVAYSPQPPEEEDLPHYKPPGPTIREFFATLGARRPPESGSAASFTAHAMVPEIDALPEVDDMAEWHDEESLPESAPEEARPVDEFPHVSDAFANLFPDSPISEEDTRAAFALSGALSSQPAPNVMLTDLPPTTPAPASSASALEVPQAAQESAEDIRRFREWLDGLADS